MPYMFSPAELRLNQNIAKNEAFYKEKFETHYKLYCHMSAEEKTAFPQFLKDNNYYAWLGLSDQLILANEAILIMIATWINCQAYVAYIETLTREIYDLFKVQNEQGKLSFQYQNIYTANIKLVKSLDNQQDIRERVIRSLIANCRVIQPKPKVCL